MNILFLKCGDPRDGTTDKGICHTSLWWPEFDPQNPCKGRIREFTPLSCALTYTHTSTHARTQ